MSRLSQLSLKASSRSKQPSQPHVTTPEDSTQQSQATASGTDASQSSLHSSGRVSASESPEEMRRRVQQETSKREEQMKANRAVGRGVRPSFKVGVLGRLRMQRVKKLRAFRQSSGVIYETSGGENSPMDSIGSPAHPRTLSQLSLYDLSFSDPNFIAMTGWKPSAKHPRQKPRLKRYFNETKPQTTPGTDHRPNFCCICGRAAYDFHPLLKACLCFTESHSNCVVQQIIYTANYNCPVCNTQYNLHYGGCKPFWKWRCPPCHPVWCHLAISIVAWLVLLGSITMLLLMAGPVYKTIDVSFETTVITAVVLVVVMCVCIVVIMITGAEPFCFFCQTFCLTNQDVTVLEHRPNGSGTSSADSVILRQITGQSSGYRQPSGVPPKATTSKA